MQPEVKGLEQCVEGRAAEEMTDRMGLSAAVRAGTVRGDAYAIQIAPEPDTVTGPQLRQCGALGSG